MDIKKPDLKALLEKLSALRNYMNLVVPLIIAVVAGLMFIPTALLNVGLKQKIKTESLGRGRALDRMVEAPISKDQILVEREYLKVYADDANQIEQMAIQSDAEGTAQLQDLPCSHGHLGVDLRGVRQAISGWDRGEDYPIERA